MAIRGLADTVAWEKVPLRQRLGALDVYGALDRAARDFADKPALHWLPTGAADDPGQSWSFRGLIACIRQTANLYHSLGLGPEDVVSLLLPIGPETFFCLYGAETQCIANPINPFLETHHVVGILKEAGTKVLVGCDNSVVPGLWDKAEAVRAALPGLVATIRIGGPGGSRKPPILDFGAAIADQPSGRLVAPRRAAPESTVALFHTGGTTGLPKLARHTQLGAVAHSHTNAVVSEPGPDNVMLNGLPPFHVGGSMCGGLTPLTNGQAVVLLSPGGMRNPTVLRDYWRIAERFKATILGAVPTSWAALLNVAPDGADLSAVRFGLTGGSALPAEIGKAVEQRLGLRLVEGYGMTELHGYSAMTPVGVPSRFGSAGIRVPYAEMLIAKVRDGRIERECGEGEIGSVLWRGPQVFGGYLNPAHAKGAMVEGWLDSGDLGRVDGDGYIWLTGRAKDIIIRGGHNLDPQLIEDALYLHEAVEIAAAVGRPDRHAGEIPVAFVQLKPGARVDVETLRDFARAHIAERAAAPSEIFLLDVMPTTAVGKIFKPKLRYQAAEIIFGRDLQHLAQRGLAIAVAVGPHDRHGTLATIRVDRCAASERAALAAEIGDILGPYQLRHEIGWG